MRFPVLFRSGESLFALAIPWALTVNSMNIASKWLEGVDPADLVSDVTRRALSQKLPIVFYHLSLAAWHQEDDIEYVHQLRVASRRAVTVLRTFELTLPSNRSQKMRKWMRRFRQAAGTAREWDVLHARLLEEQNRGEHHGIEIESLGRLMSVITRCRGESQPAIQQVCERQAEREIEWKSRDLVEAIRWRGGGDEPEWNHAARRMIQPQIKTVLKRMQRLDSSQNLHRFRIAVKELRYTMELAAGAFDEAFRTRLYPFVREIQQQLGAINDHVCSVGLFESLRLRDEAELPPEMVQRLIGRETGMLEKATQIFRESWTAEQAAWLTAELHQLLSQDKS